MFDFSKNELYIKGLLDYFQDNNCVDLTRNSLRALQLTQEKEIALLQCMPKSQKKVVGLTALKLSNKIITIFADHATQVQTDIHSLVNSVDISQLDAESAAVFDKLQNNALTEQVQSYLQFLNACRKITF